MKQEWHHFLMQGRWYYVMGKQCSQIQSAADQFLAFINAVPSSIHCVQLFSQLPFWSPQAELRLWCLTADAGFFLKYYLRISDFKSLWFSSCSVSSTILYVKVLEKTVRYSYPTGEKGACEGLHHCHIRCFYIYTFQSNSNWSCCCNLLLIMGSWLYKASHLPFLKVADPFLFQSAKIWLITADYSNLVGSDHLP